jgi:hypothetical protein
LVAVIERADGADHVIVPVDPAVGHFLPADLAPGPGYTAGFDLPALEGTLAMEQIAENRAPQAVDDAYSVDEDGSLTVPAAQGVLVNDGDADGDTVTLVARSSTSNGTVTLFTTGALKYTPFEDFHGTDSFTYWVSDGNGGTDTATVAITVNPVNDAPVPGTVSEYLYEGDGTRTVDLLAGAFDADGDELTVRNVSVTSDAGRDLTEVVVFDGVEVSIDTDAFVDLRDEIETLTLAYEIFDGTVAAAATTTVEIDGFDEEPEAVDDALSTAFGTAVNFDPTANDKDAEGAALSVIDVELLHSDDGEVVIEDDGTVTFTPADNVTGEVELLYSVSDGSQTNRAMVAIAVGDPGDRTITATLDGPIVERDEDGTVGTLTLTRTGDLRVRDAFLLDSFGGTADERDFMDVREERIEFAPGESVKTFDVGALILGDDEAEGSESFFLTLTPEPVRDLGRAPGEVTLAGDIVVTDDYESLIEIEIRDDDPEFEIDSPVVAEGNDGTTPVTFTFRRNADSSEASDFFGISFLGGTATGDVDFP